MEMQRGSPEISCVDFRWSAERDVLDVLEVQARLGRVMSCTSVSSNREVFEFELES